MAFFGNIFVIILLSRYLHKSQSKKKRGKKAKLNAVLILNLAMSDLLVSVGKCVKTKIFLKSNMDNLQFQI